jgi:zinc D-Ala-D-Ala dipeptidase
MKTIDLLNLQKIIPNLHKDIRYATADNFTGKVIYPTAGCYLRKATAQKLFNVQKELNELGLELTIFDAYRPHSVQKILWNLCPDERYVADPAKGSKHNRGSAVDLTLRDKKTGVALVMPSEYDDFSEKAHRTYATMDHTAALNCKLLELIMVKHGFIPLETEWWHFDDAEWKSYEILDISFEELENGIIK